MGPTGSIYPPAVRATENSIKRTLPHGQSVRLSNDTASPPTIKEKTSPVSTDTDPVHLLPEMTVEAHVKKREVINSHDLKIRIGIPPVAKYHYHREVRDTFVEDDSERSE